MILEMLSVDNFHEVDTLQVLSLCLVPKESKGNKIIIK